MAQKKNLPPGKHPMVIADVKLTNKDGVEKVFIPCEATDPKLVDCAQVPRTWPKGAPGLLKFYQKFGQEFDLSNLQSIKGRHFLATIAPGKNGFMNIVDVEPL